MVSKFLIPAISASGLEINEMFCSLAVVKTGEKKKVRYHEEPLPPGVIVDGKIVDKDAVVKTLKKLTRTKGQTRYAVVSIPETDVFTEVIRLPAMPPEQVNEFLDLNTPASLPFNKNDLVLGWQDIEFEAMKSERAIFLVSASKSVTSGFADALSEAGYVPMVVEPTSLSIARLIPKTPERKLLIYLRSAGSVYTMVENGIVDFSLSSAVGLNKLKVEGMNEGTAIAAFSKEIASEVNKVLRFQGQGVKRIVYASELDIELADAINIATKLPVEKISLSDWSLNKDDRIGHMLPALGAGLRGAVLSERDKEPTLLPFSARLFYHFRRAKILFRTLDIVAVTATISILLFLFAGYGVLSYQKETLDNRAKTADISEDDKKLISDIEKTNKRLSEIKQIYETTLVWTGISKLALPASSGIRYTGYQSNTEKMEVNVTGFAMDIDDLQRLLSTYRQTSEFLRAEIPNQLLGQKTNINFTIKITLKEEALVRK